MVGRSRGGRSTEELCATAAFVATQKSVRGVFKKATSESTIGVSLDGSHHFGWTVRDLNCLKINS